MSGLIVLLLMRYLMLVVIFGVTTYLVVALGYSWLCYLIALVIYALAEEIYDDFKDKGENDGLD